MSFSNTASLVREKESKALFSFLTLSRIGSLGIHAGVLASGIVHYLTSLRRNGDGRAACRECKVKYSDVPVVEVQKDE